MFDFRGYFLGNNGYLTSPSKQPQSKKILHIDLAKIMRMYSAGDKSPRTIDKKQFKKKRFAFIAPFTLVFVLMKNLVCKYLD